MKKIFFTLLAFAGMLASCSNDDIEIIQTQNTVTVNPSYVISPFTYENVTGELESFPTDYKLRVRVLAYDADGVLKASDTQFLSSYAGLASCNLGLPSGTYTVVALTDVVQTYDGSSIELEYWTLSDESNLSTTKVTDAGYLGGVYKILGVASQQLTVGEGSSESILYPQPAGALCLVEWYNIDTFADIPHYELLMNKTSDFIQFNSFGAYEVSILNQNGEYNWRLGYVEPAEETAVSVYNYYFTLPMSNVSFKYQYRNSDGDYYDMTNGSIVDLEAGGEYWFCLNLKDEDQGGGVTYACGRLLNDLSGAAMYGAPQQKAKNANPGVLYLKDIKAKKTVVK